jgi:hypothetical protein
LQLAGLSAEERLTVTRERNRDHSRKSRQRKKAFINGLQKQVDDLGVFKLLVEQAGDPISMHTADDRVRAFPSASLPACGPPCV